MLVIGSARAARSADAAIVRVGYAPVEITSDLFSALEMGFFTKEDLTVNAQVIGTGSATIAATVNGTIDIGQANVVSIAEAYAKNLPITCVALGGLYSSAAPADGLVVPASSRIASARDLNGKTVAINVLNGIAYLGVRSGIDKDGGDSSTIQFVEMPFSVMEDALAAHRVDAALIAQPELRQAIESGARLLSYPYNSIALQFPVTCWVASTQFVNANVAIARRFHNAMQKAEIWANRNQDRTAEFVAKYTKANAATVRSMTRAPFPVRTDVTLLQPVINAAAKYGLLKSAFPAADLFNKQVVG